MPDYRYDLFVSVKTNSVYDPWIKEYILSRFLGYLRNDVIAICERPLGPHYFYQNGLKAGDPWPDDLKDTIKRSRVALALCSPEYFLPNGATLNSRILDAESKKQSGGS